MIVQFGVFCGQSANLRVRWETPPQRDPFAAVRIQDLREELRQTGYRLVIAIHPAPADKADNPPRDLYIVNADGTGLKQLTNTKEVDEHVPRTSPDGTMFTYNYGDYLVKVKTLKTRELYGGYVWTPDSRETVACEKNGITYMSVETGKKTRTVKVPRQVDIVDLTADGSWFTFELRNYLGCQYTIDFLAATGGEIRKLPNHPIQDGECHPSFSPDGQWLCWNAGTDQDVMTKIAELGRFMCYGRDSSPQAPKQSGWVNTPSRRCPCLEGHAPPIINSRRNASVEQVS